MPLFKGVASKSTPKKAIDYITRKDKAAFVSVRNLFEDEDYAEQFADTMQRFNKGKKFDERKYYHFKLSCARKDNVRPEQAHLYAEELAAILFPDDECVIATHTDTKTVHSHIIVNAVNPITGKKLRITESDYTKMKDEANRLGSEFGYSTIDFRKKAQNKRTTEESHIIYHLERRHVMERRFTGSHRRSGTQFVHAGRIYITHCIIRRSGNTKQDGIFILASAKEKSHSGGLKLGNNYTKQEVLNVIGKQRNGNGSYAFNGDRRNQSEKRQISGDDGQSVIARSVSDIERAMQQLGKQVEYAHQGLDGESEERKRREREKRERLERERIERSRSNEELARRNENAEQISSDGNKSSNKKNDNYFGK